MTGGRFEPLPETSYEPGAVEVARGLLGMILVRLSPEGASAGRIIETEAYASRDDPACHAARGRTKRNAAMFGPGGHAYVYFIYGMHHCFNAVTGPEGIAEAVLVRALEPLEGIELMLRRRPRARTGNPCLGPGNLCAALAIDTSLNGASLLGPPLFIARGHPVPGSRVGSSGRIGIRAGREKPWRFFIRG